MKRTCFLVVCLFLAILLSGCIEINVGEAQAPAEETPAEAVTSTPEAEEPEATQTLETGATPSPVPAPISHELEYYLNLTPTVCKPFLPSDWVFGDLYYGASSAEAVTLYGSPNSTESVEWGADGSIHEYQYFDFGYLGYEDDMLNTVHVKSAGYAGPRDIEVGDTLESVILKFCTTYEKYDSSSIIYYRENPGRDNDICLPPSATLFVYDTKSLYYAFHDTADYLDEDIAVLEDYVMYTPSYSFSLQFDENDVLASYSLYYGASAE